MAPSLSTPSKKKKTSPLSFGVSMIVKLIEWSLACSLVPLLITLASLAFIGQRGELDHLENLFQQQIAWLKVHNSHIVFGQSFLAETLYWVHALQQASHFLASLNHCDAHFHYPFFKQLAKSICPIAHATGSALLLTLQITLLRMAVVLLFLPLFAVLGLVAFIDGLVQRHLRRINGGRESALIYHQTRNAVLPTLFILTFVYVAIPTVISPLLLLLPTAILLAVLLFLATKSFKKYL